MKWNLDRRSSPAGDDGISNIELDNAWMSAKGCAGAALELKAIPRSRQGCG